MSQQTQALPLPSTFGTAVGTGPRSTSSRLALGAIRFYRSYLSPLKGFKCASGVMGGQTCSTAGLEFFTRYPLREAFTRQRRQFRECGEMMRIFNIAVRNDQQTATAMITHDFGKTPEEALRLFNTAVAYEAKRTGNSDGQDSRRSKKQTGNNRCDPCYPAADCGSSAVWCMPSPGRIDGCDVAGACDGPGGCDGPGAC